MKGIIVKLKKGKEQQWINWCKELQGPLRKEALKTIKEEGLNQEFAAICTINNSSYIVGMIEGDALDPDPNNPINIKHKQMKEECFDMNHCSKIETLCHFKVN